MYINPYPITPSMEEDERLMRRSCPPEFRETLERWLAACRAELLRQYKPEPGERQEGEKGR